MRCTLILITGLSLLGCEGVLNDSADTDDSQTTDGSTGATGSDGCQSSFSDFTLAVGTPSSTGQVGQACDDPTAPTNCLDGSHITFSDTGECICIAQCASLGADQGESCDQNDLYICQTVTGASGGPYCVARNWNICGDDSGSTGGDGGTDGTDGLDETTGEDSTDLAPCKPDGLACDDDAECCSQTCFASGCG